MMSLIAAREGAQRRLVLLAVLVALLAAAGNAASQSAGPTGDAVEVVGQGMVNWTSGEVFATGIGAPPPNAVNPAQARAMAERAATVVALRNLLEIVKGIRVDSETVVENFITKSDIIKTRVDGVVRGAMPVKKQYLSDGSVEITVAMKLKGDLLDAIVPGDFGGRTAPLPMPLPAPALPRAPQDAKQVLPPPATKPQSAPQPPVPEKRTEPTKPPPAPPSPQQQEKKPEPQLPPPPAPVMADQSSLQFKGGKATGIVIDGRGLGLKPALLPKIVDPQGQEIYVGQVVTRTNAVEQGVAGYARDVSAAANNFRVTDNPAVIKAQRSAGAARTDIVLAQTDAQKLRELSREGNFLQYCRVIIVY